MSIHTHRFENGIRLVHKEVNSMVANFGFIVHTGSRDELEEEQGMAHFIEHTIFKGTKKRKAYHILSRMEDVGGEINAYTTKEDTCVYAAFLRQDYDRAVELIYDLCFNSTFPEKEINREKTVIIDEILSYLDTPSELIFDEFEEMVFNRHAIGRSILGTEAHLKKFRRKDIRRFMLGNYATDEMVLCSVGKIKFDKFVKICEAYFGQVPRRSRRRPRIAPGEYTPVSLSVNKDSFQAHCVTGNLAYDVNSPGRVPLALLTNILGGPGMNSRLSLSLREKNGYAYNIESQYTSYSDTGIFTTYFGCEKDSYEKCLKLVYKEFDKVRRQKLGTLQLSRAKKQLIGQVAIAAENNEHLMLSMGKNILVYDRVDSLEDIARMIEDVNSSQLLEIANEVLDINRLTLLHYY
jgi:predicted Zn-dependent peptidase